MATLAEKAPSKGDNGHVTDAEPLCFWDMFDGVIERLLLEDYQPPNQNIPCQASTNQHNTLCDDEARKQRTKYRVHDPSPDVVIHHQKLSEKMRLCDSSFERTSSYARRHQHISHLLKVDRNGTHSVVKQNSQRKRKIKIKRLRDISDWGLSADEEEEGGNGEDSVGNTRAHCNRDKSKDAPAKSHPSNEISKANIREVMFNQSKTARTGSVRSLSPSSDSPSSDDNTVKTASEFTVSNTQVRKGVSLQTSDSSSALSSKDSSCDGIEINTTKTTGTTKWMLNCETEDVATGKVGEHRNGRHSAKRTANNDSNSTNDSVDNVIRSAVGLQKGYRHFKDINSIEYEATGGQGSYEDDIISDNTHRCDAKSSGNQQEDPIHVNYNNLSNAVESTINLDNPWNYSQTSSYHDTNKHQVSHGNINHTGLDGPHTPQVALPTYTRDSLNSPISGSGFMDRHLHGMDSMLTNSSIISTTLNTADYLNVQVDTNHDPKMCSNNSDYTVVNEIADISSHSLINMSEASPSFTTKISFMNDNYRSGHLDRTGEMHSKQLNHKRRNEDDLEHVHDKQLDLKRMKSSVYQESSTSDFGAKDGKECTSVTGMVYRKSEEGDNPRPILNTMRQTGNAHIDITRQTNNQNIDRMREMDNEQIENIMQLDYSNMDTFRQTNNEYIDEMRQTNQPNTDLMRQMDHPNASADRMRQTDYPHAMGSYVGQEMESSLQDNGSQAPSVLGEPDGMTDQELQEKNEVSPDLIDYITTIGTGELDEEEIKTIMDILLRAQRNFKNVVPSVNPEEFQNKLRLYMEHKKAEAGGSDVMITEAEARKCVFLEHLLKYFEKKIGEIVKFAKHIPGFRELCMDDQANLIKVSRTESGLVGGFPGVNMAKKEITAEKRSFSMQDLGTFISPQFLVEFKKICKKVADAKITEHEAALLRGIIITFTDRCHLEEPDHVQLIQNKLVTCLHYVLERDGTDTPPDVRLGELLHVITCLRNYTDVDSSILQETLKNYPNYSTNDLVTEFLGPPTQ